MGTGYGGRALEPGTQLAPKRKLTGRPRLPGKSAREEAVFETTERMGQWVKIQEGNLPRTVAIR